MVKAVCHRILGDAALAEDAAQKVFLLMVRKLPSLPPRTILGGWLYVAACHLARTHQRALVRRWQRENQPDAMENLINPAPDTLWCELESLLDNAMLTLSRRQRELVLFRYFQNNTQRAAAGLVGCSESVASRELAAAIESLRRFFSRHGVTVSGTALSTLLTAHGAQASIGAAIPLLVSQLDNDRVSRTVESYLKNLDPVMELALIEAAAPPGLYFDPEKSRLILDPLITKDPGLELVSGEGSGSNKEELLWNSVSQTAKRQAEDGRPADAMEWLATLNFASQNDYAKVLGNVLTV
jgi:RNA polymerase sigma factor (sigma-70 family)